MNVRSMQEGTKIPTKMWTAAMLICLSSFMFGYSLSSLNSCLVLGSGDSASKCFSGDDDGSPSCPPGTIYNDLNLSAFEASVATSLTVVGGWIGCMQGSLPEKFGRKKVLMSNNFLYIVGALMAASGNDIMLYLGRFIIGLAVGITSVVAPVLLAECASDDHRGIITTQFQLILTIGIFSASLIAYGFVTYVAHGWQYVQAFGAVPAIVMLLCATWVPESPKWLLAHGKQEAATAVLASLRSDDDNVDVEVQRLLLSAEEDEPMRKSSGDDVDVTWTDVFVWKRSVIIGCGLLFIQVSTSCSCSCLLILLTYFLSTVLIPLGTIGNQLCDFLFDHYLWVRRVQR